MPHLIPRILRVDHAGEHGAVALYSAQLPPSALTRFGGQVRTRVRLRSARYGGQAGAFLISSLGLKKRARTKRVIARAFAKPGRRARPSRAG